MSDINRKVHEFYAKGNGYFWLPCPFPGCGRMFGGHEYGAYSIRDNDNPNSGSMTCKLHDKFARQVFNLRFPGVEYWSSDGSFHYTGDVESDLRLVRAVSEFRQLAQCTHEDMNCPPGECEDLYPPNREDAGR